MTRYSLDDDDVTVIIGSGPGGATLALQLVRAGKKVVMLSRSGVNRCRSFLSIAIATAPIARLSCPVIRLNTYYPNAATASQTPDRDRWRHPFRTGVRGARLSAA